MSWRIMDELDCSFRGRIGFFLPQKLDTWFDFGEDPAELRNRFSYCSEESLTILATYTQQLKDPAPLLLKKANCNLLRPFLLSYHPLFLASIEMRLGQLDEAEKRLESPFSDEEVERFHRPRHLKLIELIRRLREAKGDPEQTRRLLEWITN
jgi:hypothetical protein